MQYKIVKKLNYKQESAAKKAHVDALCAALLSTLPSSWKPSTEDAKVVFSIGGDGTMMHAMSQNISALVVGINAGNVGFLTPFEPSDVKKVCDLLVRYEQQSADLSAQVDWKCHGVRVEHRALLQGSWSSSALSSAPVLQLARSPSYAPMLPSDPSSDPADSSSSSSAAACDLKEGSAPSCEPFSSKSTSSPQERSIFDTLCVNEFAISGVGPNDMLSFDISVVYRGSVSAAGSYKANALLVSAPCGSTAYNMNAGGAIVDPTVACMQLLLIAPTMLGARPWIVGKNSRIVVRVHKAANIYSDGILVKRLAAGQSFEVSLLPQEVRLLLPLDWNFYSVLSSKLHWNNGRGV